MGVVRGVEIDFYTKKGAKKLYHLKGEDFYNSIGRHISFSESTESKYTNL